MHLGQVFQSVTSFETEFVYFFIFLAVYDGGNLYLENSIDHSYNWRSHIKESGSKWKLGRTKLVLVPVLSQRQLDHRWQVLGSGLA